MEGNRQACGAVADRPDLATCIIMLLGGALASLAMVAISSVLPAIDAALARTPDDSLLVKQLLGVVGFAMMFGSILAGFLFERVPSNRILLAAGAVYVAAGTAGLYLDDLRILVATRFLLGLAAAMIQITSFTLINTRLDGTRRAQWMGYHITAAMACTILIHPIAGLIGDHGWRGPFALHALGLLILPAAYFCRDKGGKLAGAAQNALGSRGRGEPFWRRFPVHYLLLAILVGGVVFVPAVYAPFVLREKGLASPSIIALVLTADSIAGAIVASQYGRARRLLDRHGAFCASFAIVAIGTAIAGLSPGTPGVILGMVIYGLGTGWLVPNLMTSVGEKLSVERQARAVGLVKAAHFSSSGIALFAMEPVARAYGPQSGLLFIAATAIALLLALGLRRGILRAPAPESVPA